MNESSDSDDSDSETSDSSDSNDNTNKQNYRTYFNRSIGRTGPFYMDCREKLCKRKKYSNVNKYIINPKITKLSFPNPNSKLKYNPINNVDMNHSYCHTCNLDQNTKLFFRNYDNFPSTNGPPGTNEFTH
jgi:hypothetical protein